jgi:MFS family permease
MDYFDKKLWLCVTTASMCLTACICAYLNIVSLTVNRWLFLCHDEIYDKIYNKFTSTFICIVTWLLGVGAELPNFLGIGGHYFDEKSHQCIWNRRASRTYTIIICLGFITAPMILLLFCNTAIFIKIWKVRKNVCRLSTG